MANSVEVQTAHCTVWQRHCSLFFLGPSVRYGVLCHGTYVRCSVPAGWVVFFWRHVTFLCRLCSTLAMKMETWRPAGCWPTGTVRTLTLHSRYSVRLVCMPIGSSRTVLRPPARCLSCLPSSHGTVVIFS